MRGVEALRGIVLAGYVAVALSPRAPNEKVATAEIKQLADVYPDTCRICCARVIEFGYN